MLAEVPRHLFVDEAMATRAYEDVSLPIGEGQTISRPWSVARMTELLLGAGADEAGEPIRPARARVLEVGTGSGYQAAVLSRLVDEVYTVERIRSLLERARHPLSRAPLSQRPSPRLQRRRLGMAGQGAVRRDHRHRRPPRACRKPLLDQLAVGGRMIVPVGARRGGQSLTVITRTPSGFDAWRDGDAHFVPFLPGKA